MLKVPDVGKCNFSDGLKEEVIRVDERKKLTQETAPYAAPTRKVLLIQLNILTLTIWKLIYSSYERIFVDCLGCIRCCSRFWPKAEVLGWTIGSCRYLTIFGLPK